MTSHVYEGLRFATYARQFLVSCRDVTGRSFYHSPTSEASTGIDTFIIFHVFYLIVVAQGHRIATSVTSFSRQNPIVSDNRISNFARSRETSSSQSLCIQRGVFSSTILFYSRQTNTRISQLRVRPYAQWRNVKYQKIL